MVMLMAETEAHNVLHLIQGPESDLHYAIHGSIVLNISSLLSQMNGDKPVLLNLTRCDSEAEKTAHLAALTARGMVYPFQAQTAVFGPKAQLEAAVAESEARKKEKEPPEAPTGKCSRCGGQENSSLVPGLNPPICLSCAQIDLGLAKAKKPAAKK